MFPGQARARLEVLGKLPRGAYEHRHPDVHHPSWRFMWAGPGSVQSMLADLFDLVGRLGGVVEHEDPIDVDAIVAAGSFSETVKFPLLGLDGNRAGIDFPLRLQFWTPPNLTHVSGFLYKHAVGVRLQNYWTAPLGPGDLHDNRGWAELNKLSLPALLLGVRELGLICAPDYPDGYLVPVDAFGFAEADVDWLRSEVDKRWRAFVEGELTLEQYGYHETPPVVPPGNPAYWSLFGFKRSLAELESLLDGVPGGDVAAARILPWFEAAESAQVVGEDDELLATGAELKEQLAFAVSSFDSSLAAQLRSLPVLLDSEAATGFKSAINLRKISWKLLGDDGGGSVIRSVSGTDVQRTFYGGVRDLCRDKLAAAHFAAPVFGVDLNLQAAFDLWQLSGEIKITNDGFVVGVDDTYWAG